MYVQIYKNLYYAQVHTRLTKMCILRLFLVYKDLYNGEEMKNIILMLILIYMSDYFQYIKIHIMVKR